MGAFALSNRVVLTLIAIFTSANLAAQQDAGTGRIAGTLQDRTGGVIQSASVEIRRIDGRQMQTSVTNAQGRYVFGAVLPGQYTVTAVARGFDPAVRGEIIVSPGTEALVDFALEVAPLQSLVEVTAETFDRPLRVDTDPRQPRQPIPAHDGADYLKTIPGFSVIRKGGTDGDPVLRGMAGSRLGILVDGENIFGGCGNRMDPPTAYVYPQAFDRITILKGPQTVAHGPGNSAGVVLFERGRGVTAGVHVFASPTFGSFGRNDQVADVKVGGRAVYLRAAATRSSMGDYEDGNGRAVHSNYERWSTNGAVGWTPDADTVLELSTAFSDGQAAYADRTMDGVKFSRQNAGIRFERRNLSRVVQTLDAQAFYNYVDHVMDNFSLRSFTPSMAMPGQSVSNPDRRTIGARVAAGLQFSAATMVRVGVDWQDNRHTVRSTTNQVLDPYAGHSRMKDATFESLGVFGELTQALGPRQRIVAGARVDRWAGRDYRTTVKTGMASSVANPTAGAERLEVLGGGFGRYEREVTTASTFYAGVGHVARTPDYWELVSKESIASASGFGTRPEKTTQLDVGMLYRRGAASASAALFVNDISDFILVQSNYVKIASTSMNGMSATSRMTTVARNVDASTWGGEASFALAVTSRFKLDTSLAYVRGDNDTDHRPLAQLTPLEGRVGLQYAADRWSVGALTRLVGAQKRFALNQGNIVGQDLGPTARFAVFSMNGGARINGLARVSAGVDNLFDATYAEFVSRSGAGVPGFTTTTRVNEPGRTLWIKLDIRR